MLSCSWRGGKAGSLFGVRVGMCPGVRPEGWLRLFAHRLGGIICRGHAHVQYKLLLLLTPLFLLQVPQTWQLVFLVSLYLLSRICLGLPKHIVIFSPIWFLCILLLEERCVQVQALQLCSKASHVPACLKRRTVPWMHAT